ncbi:MAG: GTP cyclohydrolase I FolE [Bacillota bacterium]
MTEDQFMLQKLQDLFKGTSGDLDKDIIKARQYMDGIKNLIEICGDDPDRDGLQDTPFRVLKAFLEYTEGYREDPKAHLEKVFDVDHKELVMVKDIEFYSMCEHHFAPFFGVAHVGYIPDKKITGLSKIGRMVDGYAKRFQVQERLTNEIVSAVEEVLEPQGAMVVIEAKHMCMCGRGIKKSTASTTTTAVRGIFADKSEARMEFLSLLNR